MSNPIFHYPGNKARMASQIIELFPDHHCYVEPFGGAASILFSKPRSSVEVYNDINDDIVTFFQVFRDEREALVEYLESMPYSESLYEEIARQWFDEEDRPKDMIEYAARFFFLRYSQFGSGLGWERGFRSMAHRSAASQFVQGVDRLTEFRDRLRDVNIHCSDYRRIVDKYDSEDTFFYFDPPYLGPGDDLYQTNEEGFDHEEFVERVAELDSRWLLSYGDVPDGLEEYYTIQQETGNTVHSREGEQRRETLIMNYDPETVQPFAIADVGDPMEW